MGEAGQIALALRIYGRVQGVGYRAWAVHTARQLGLSGWVRNLTDGTVEAFVIGGEDAVGAFVAACHAGPPGARVTNVASVKHETGAAPNPPGFQQRPTAAP